MRVMAVILVAFSCMPSASSAATNPGMEGVRCSGTATSDAGAVVAMSCTGGFSLLPKDFSVVKSSLIAVAGRLKLSTPIQGDELYVPRPNDLLVTDVSDERVPRPKDLLPDLVGSIVPSSNQGNPSTGFSLHALHVADSYHMPLFATESLTVMSAVPESDAWESLLVGLLGIGLLAGMKKRRMSSASRLSFG